MHIFFSTALVAADFERAFKLAQATDDASREKLKAWLQQHVYKGKVAIKIATARTTRRKDRVQLLIGGPFDNSDETIAAAEQTVVVYPARVEVFKAREKTIKRPRNVALPNQIEVMLQDFSRLVRAKVKRFPKPMTLRPVRPIRV